mmetsp:Transcript_24520/g.36071  ORF Transcript_24520/g.36071 Transcript_24520/m.36071 type:complete len:1122 (-) Transcript_24520:233-3598(-)|eukprot:CAMPEP_0185029300 /NCGR_PEP_ID=MMETSP1103-20130426/15507_1 /TAXON_ID=36769 /ORGANISM="Paraphysomonas bandaiensis, Strain Caron Lab Isolate" /LENGTH=1121 /DNA_ID=CAMNT_0027563985 /DNA_START=66 /DNA_END=3431 /DNA_ORIENTATION=+
MQNIEITPLLGCFTPKESNQTQEIEGKNIRNEGSVLMKATVSLTDTYKNCNPNFEVVEKLPARLLTQPSEPCATNSHDNVEGNLICRVRDKIESDTSSYTVLDLLGTGTFGQVFRCQMSTTGDIVAVKVVKGKTAYRNQGLLEVKIAKQLNTEGDPDDSKHIVRILDSFEYCGHVCIVFELLGSSLLDILTQNQFRGLPLNAVQKFARQILAALVVLEDSKIIHCDLKPENILLYNRNKQQRSHSKTEASSTSTDITNSRQDSDNVSNGKTNDMGKGKDQQGPSMEISTGVGLWSDVKVIDFGSACFEGRTMYSYIQSRFYRSPEVLLGVPYNGAIDMWSLGCVCAEMFLGLPLFPGVSQHNQLTRIVDMLGAIPDYLIQNGKNGTKFFTTSPSVPADRAWNPYSSQSQTTRPTHTYRLKTAEEYALENNTTVPTFRRYLKYNVLSDVILKCPLSRKSRLTEQQKREEINKRKCFLDFLQGLLKLDPWQRLTAKQAVEHPFITNYSSIGGSSEDGVIACLPYSPRPDKVVQERLRQYHGKLPDSVYQMCSAKYGTTVETREFSLLKKSDRRESEPVNLGQRCDVAPTTRGSGSGNVSGSDVGVVTQQPGDDKVWPPYATPMWSETTPSSVPQHHQMHRQDSRNGPRAAASDSGRPRRYSNPASYSHQARRHPQGGQGYPNSGPQYGSPPEHQKPTSFFQWQQQKHGTERGVSGGYYSSSLGGSPSNQMGPQQQQQAQSYSFSGSMISSLFHHQQQSFDSPSEQSKSGSMPIPMPASGQQTSSNKIASSYNSTASSYGSSLFASSLGGIGSGPTDFGHALNRADIDESRYLQSFGFQSAPHHHGQSIPSHRMGSSYGNSPHRRGTSRSAQRPPLSASYSHDYASHPQEPMSEGRGHHRTGGHRPHQGWVGGQGQGYGNSPDRRFDAYTHTQYPPHSPMAGGHEKTKSVGEPLTMATHESHSRSDLHHSEPGTWATAQSTQGGTNTSQSLAYSAPHTQSSFMSMLGGDDDTQNGDTERTLSRDSKITSTPKSTGIAINPKSAEPCDDNGDDELFFESDDFLSGADISPAHSHSMADATMAMGNASLNSGYGVSSGGSGRHMMPNSHPNGNSSAYHQQPGNSWK